MTACHTVFLSPHSRRRPLAQHNNNASDHGENELTRTLDTATRCLSSVSSRVSPTVDLAVDEDCDTVVTAAKGLRVEGIWRVEIDSFDAALAHYHPSKLPNLPPPFDFFFAGSSAWKLSSMNSTI